LIYHGIKYPLNNTEVFLPNIVCRMPIRRVNRQNLQTSGKISSGDPQGGILPRANNFDALRLFLAVVVIFSHSFPLGTGSNSHEPLLRATNGQITFGTLAVDWFFVISGFLITQSWHNSRNAWSYLKKRICRIYPGFLAAVIIGTVVIVPLGGGSFPFSMRNIMVFAGRAFSLALPNSYGAFASNPLSSVINGSAWSIPYEFCCYLLIAFLGVTQLIRGRRFILCFFIVSLMVGLGIAVAGWTPDVALPFGLGRLLRLAGLIPIYLSGVVFYIYRERIPLDWRLAIFCLAGLCAAAVVPFGMTLTLPICGTYVLFFIAFNRRFRISGVTKFGDLSYGVYLYAFPIQQLIVFKAGHSINPWLLFALALPPSLVAGALSWTLVERWFLKKRTLAGAARPAIRQDADQATPIRAGATETGA
jgi:peptidoglycan/LPS O-acetylase OafA/YrhL